MSVHDWLCSFCRLRVPPVYICEDLATRLTSPPRAVLVSVSEHDFHSLGPLFAHENPGPLS